MRISDGSSFRQNIGTVQEGDLIKIEQRGKRRVKAMRFPSSDTLQRRKRLTIKEASLAQSETKAILTTVSSNYNFTSSISSYPNSSKPSKDYTKSSYFGTQVFTYEELEVATYNFNDSREVGDRGFGTVYYGKLIDGREVAVKRLYENNFNRVERFLNEVEILTRLEHENLVKLYGCTSKRSNELILVYEYIPNGTVADHLHGKLANSSSSIFSCHGDSENTLTLGNDDPSAGNSSGALSYRPRRRIRNPALIENDIHANKNTSTHVDCTDTTELPAYREHGLDPLQHLSLGQLLQEP
uniref:Leaf rust 10 disease-resistance locus receptor-like protein kinase-like 1.4 n=1 Tax=Tanacetum cinerariifolium TaxID=118510 RepID=A0A6L2K751_TANCI|nr:leaf rust 10 disease-resistance locus receptor-like protein kinase-like 1.4 [Tanacetum cinerariifolium]